MQALRRHKWAFVIIVLLLIGIMVGRNLDQSKYSLNYSSYQISSDKINTPVRILQLTDLHNSEFGENNQELIDRVATQSPDLILITGDLLNSDEPRTDIAANLISSLCDITPVYISLGNHEMEYQDNFGVNIIELYQAVGAEVLEYQYEDITVNGQQLRLGGIYGYCLPEKYLETDEADPEECAFLTDFQSTDLYTVLMCHIPVCWMINEGLEEWDVDCVLSGHLHGGQVVLPLIGGGYAPDMGWFPGRLKGIFSSETGNKVLVLSSGLGNTENIPRFNNIPEIVVVDLVPQSSK
ncbi:metallophosphoesterase [Bariatricus sp. HCP28S3_D3]|uniref:metallophosphoesterase n=1 Tax=Bariatricus sp. HCP28S3_D3 TaxID=3438901 RepID=UPI003F8CE0BC